MRILVTGCTGLIGSSVYKCLLKKKADVYGLCYSRTTDSNENVFKVDLASEEESIIGISQISPDIIIHTAAVLPSSHNSEESSIVASKNHLIDKHIIDYCQKHSTRLVYTSSAYIYNREETLSSLTESSTIHPEGSYLQQKYESEKRIKTSLKDYLILRVSSPFGAELKKGVIKVFIDKALNNDHITLYGNGERVQDFISVQDVALIIEELVFKNVNGIYNLSSGEPISMKQLALWVIELTESKSKLIFDESKVDLYLNNNFSNKKLLSDIDGSLKYNVRDGIVDIILKNENRSSL